MAVASKLEIQGGGGVQRPSTDQADQQAVSPAVAGAQQRVAEYKNRATRLQRLWIDVKSSGGGPGGVGRGRLAAPSERNDTYSCSWVCTGTCVCCNGGSFDRTIRGKDGQIYEWATKQEGENRMHHFLALRPPEPPARSFPAPPPALQQRPPPPGWVPAPLDEQRIWTEWADLEDQVRRAEEDEFLERKAQQLRERRVSHLASRLKGLSHSGDLESPEVQEVVALLQPFKEYVLPLCGSYFLDYYGHAGDCQQCLAPVGRAEQGLRCQNGGHWLCWPCVAANLDHEKLRTAPEHLLRTMEPDPGEREWEAALDREERLTGMKRRGRRLEEKKQALAEDRAQRAHEISAAEESWRRAEQEQHAQQHQAWISRCTVLHAEWDAYVGMRQAVQDRFHETAGFVQNRPPTPEAVRPHLPREEANGEQAQGARTIEQWQAALTKLRRQQQREGVAIQRSQSSSSVRSRPGSARARVFDKPLPEGGSAHHQQSQGDVVSPEYSSAGRLPGRSRPSSASPKQQRPCSAGSARSVVDALRPRPPSAGRQARQPAPPPSSREERRLPAAAMKPPLIAQKRPSSASGRREASLGALQAAARAPAVPNTDSGGPKLRLPLPTPPPQAPLCCGGGPLSLRA